MLNASYPLLFLFLNLSGQDRERGFAAPSEWTQYSRHLRVGGWGGGGGVHKDRGTERQTLRQRVKRGRRSLTFRLNHSAINTGHFTSDTSTQSEAEWRDETGHWPLEPKSHTSYQASIKEAIESDGSLVEQLLCQLEARAFCNIQCQGQTSLGRVAKTGYCVMGGPFLLLFLPRDVTWNHTHCATESITLLRVWHFQSPRKTTGQADELPADRATDDTSTNKSNAAGTSL